MPYRAKLDPINRRLHACLHQKAIAAVDREEACAEACDRIARQYARRVIAAFQTDEHHTPAIHRIRAAAVGFWPDIARTIDAQLRGMAQWSHRTSVQAYIDVLPPRWFRAIVPQLPLTEAYDPDEPRDASGRWGSGGGSTKSSPKQTRTLPVDTDHSTEQGIKASAQKWFDSLAPEKRDRVEQWTGGDHVDIRRGEAHGNPDAEWDSALAAAPKYDGIVYRALKASPDQLKGWNGDKSELTINASSSATRDPAHAGKFIDPSKGTLLKIVTHNGKSIEAPQLSEGIDDEREVILPRASNYRVVKVGRDVEIHSHGKTFTAPFLIELEEKESAKESRTLQSAITEQDDTGSRFLEDDPGLFITVHALRESVIREEAIGPKISASFGFPPTIPPTAIVAPAPAPGDDDPTKKKKSDDDLTRPLSSDDEYQAAVKELLFPPLDLNTINRIIYTTTDGIGWPQRLEKWSRQFANPDALANNIAVGLSQGQDLGQLSRGVRDSFGVAGSTAKRVARSEAHRVNLMAHDEASNGLGELKVGRQYLAQLDANTRPTHAIHHGEIFRNGEPLPLTLDEPNCLLPGSIVEGAFVSGLKTFYSGQALELRTLSGERLTVTPNDPILSEHGFVPACTLKKGDKLIRHNRKVPFSVGVSVGKYQAPAAVEDVFDALAARTGLATISHRVTLNLHGDERFCEGNVDIINPNRKLLCGQNAARNQFGNEPCFVGADEELLGELHFGSLLQLIPRHLDSALPGPSRFHHLEVLGPKNRIGLNSGPVDGLLFGVGAKHGPILDKQLAHSRRLAIYANTGTAADASFFGEFLDGLAGNVTCDEVLDIRYFDFSGHVFSLQSVSGWYYNNAIVSHNCRCHTIPVLAPPDDIEDDPNVKAEFANTAKEEIPDPSAYDQWFQRAPDQDRRLAVGTKRYEAVRNIAKYANRKPEWSDFLAGDSGQLLSPAQLSAETTAQRAVRKQAVGQLIQQRADDYRSVRNLGFVLKRQSGG